MARPRDPFATETIVPFPAGGDPLEAAGQTVFSLVHRAAARAEENTQHALGMAHKFSLQLLEAQERIELLHEQAGPLGSRLQAIQALAEHTVRYTELAPTRFKDFWRV